MDAIDFLIFLLLVFLAGVGLGTFVLGARIRKVVAEAVLYARNAEAKVIEKANEIKKVL